MRRQNGRPWQQRGGRAKERQEKGDLTQNQYSTTWAEMQKRKNGRPCRRRDGLSQCQPWRRHDQYSTADNQTQALPRAWTDSPDGTWADGETPRGRHRRRETRQDARRDIAPGSGGAPAAARAGGRREQETRHLHHRNPTKQTK